VQHRLRVRRGGHAGPRSERDERRGRPQGWASLSPSPARPWPGSPPPLQPPKKHPRLRATCAPSQLVVAATSNRRAPSVRPHRRPRPLLALAQPHLAPLGCCKRLPPRPGHHARLGHHAPLAAEVAPPTTPPGPPRLAPLARRRLPPPLPLGPLERRVRPVPHLDRPRCVPPSPLALRTRRPQLKPAPAHATWRTLSPSLAVGAFPPFLWTFLFKQAKHIPDSIRPPVRYLSSRSVLPPELSLAETRAA